MDSEIRILLGKLQQVLEQLLPEEIAEEFIDKIELKILDLFEKNGEANNDLEDYDLNDKEENY